MKTPFILGTALSAGSSLATALQPRASSLPSVYTHGNAFWTANTTRFYIRGVDYQPGGSSLLADPIADAAGCQRDIVKFKKLGVNTIRVYTIDNTANHDTCMQALAAAGIYLVLDVNTPQYSLNRADPNPSYNDVYLQSIFATVDAFANYPNTLAFFSGNEVVNDVPSSASAPYVKAVTRDIRQYITSRSYRQIPVGYSAADVSENRMQMAAYMNCGTNDQRSDFFAFNDYSWCDPNTFTGSGWSQKVQNFTGYTLPLFLSEFGCNTNTREWEEIAALYSTEMSAVYSGGLVYEYSNEASNYGLVDIDGTSVTELPDFATLMAKYTAQSNPSGDGGYSNKTGASTCPTYDASAWLVKDDTLPAIPDGAVKYMTQGAGTGPGLNINGTGSQNAGGASTGTATAGSGQATSTATHSGAATAVTIPAWSSTPIFVTGLTCMFALLGATLL